MRKFKKILGIVTVLMLVLTMLPTSVFAAGSYTASVSSRTVTEGKSTTLTIKTVKDAGQERNPEGQFTVTSSNPDVVKVGTSSLWVGESGKATVSLKAVKAGTATITINPVTVSDQELNLITGNKTITITVKAKATTTVDKEDNTTTTTQKSSDATLKSLSSGVAYIDFNSNTTSYTVNVDKTVSSLGLKAIANSSKATVKVTGDENFVTGNNTVKVVVTAENGATKTYTVTVIKSKYGHAPLLELEVKGYGISPEFEPDKFEYSLDAIGVTAVELDYLLADEDSKVTIEGADNLQIGRNEVKLIVTEQDGTVTTYTVDVNVAASVTEDKNFIWLIIIIILVLLIVAETIYIVMKQRKDKEAAEAKKQEAKKQPKKQTKKQG